MKDFIIALLFIFLVFLFDRYIFISVWKFIEMDKVWNVTRLQGLRDDLERDGKINATNEDPGWKIMEKRGV